jgi:hypothetical protein
MVHQPDEYGNLDVEQLTLDEKKEIFQKFQDVLNHRHYNYGGDTGEFEDSEGMSQEEIRQKVESMDDELIWTHYYMITTDESVKIDLVPGLSVYVSGPAIVNGYRESESVSHYIFATKPPTGDLEAFYSAECECPFCDGGSADDEECEICEGEGMWEWMN